MVARRTADCRSLAVITSYSSHSVQKSCCVTALSSSAIKTLGFILILSLLVSNLLQCSYRTSRIAQEERSSFEKLRTCASFETIYGRCQTHGFNVRLSSITSGIDSQVCTDVDRGC